MVAVIGGFTALLAGLIALTQHDLKRVLAYSTVSQLGYMFLGLGTGSMLGIVAGMFHLFTHAFFKALLFLGSGSVMHAMGHVIDMRKFSGLRRLMPVTHAHLLDRMSGPGRRSSLFGVLEQGCRGRFAARASGNRVRGRRSWRRGDRWRRTYHQRR